MIYIPRHGEKKLSFWIAQHKVSGEKWLSDGWKGFGPLYYADIPTDTANAARLWAISEGERDDLNSDQYKWTAIR